LRRKYQQHRIFTPNNPLSPRICPELAKEIGLNESILLLQYEFWMVTEGEERSGFFWLRKTVREVREVFKFWGVATIDRIIQKLLSKGYMIAGDFDEGPGKGGRWMRFDFERLSTLKSIKVDCSDMEQRMFRSEAKSDQSGTTVYTEEKTKTKERVVDIEKPRRKEPLIEPPFHGEDFMSALALFDAVQREKKKSLGVTRRKLVYDKLSTWSEPVATQALMEAAEAGWPTVYAPKNGNDRNGNNGNGAGSSKPVWMAPDK
jgi:hypothetical protein